MERNRNDWKYWVALQQTPSIGPSRLERLRQAYGDDLEQAWRAPAGQLLKVLSQHVVDSIVATRASLDLEALADRIEQVGATVLTRADPQYPPLLQHISMPPTVLYMRGAMTAADETGVAVIGTRRVTAYGREVTSRIAGDLARAGVTVVSGLALGVDGIAHTAALDAGGRTIAVLGSGIDHVYPPEHRALALRIAQQGAILSEHPPGVRSDPRFFPARNRIVAGMTLGTLVTEAPLKSGSLITTSFAGDYGRDVFAVPGSILSPNSEGCNKLLRDGAVVTTGAEDILRELQLGDLPEQRAVQQALPLASEERRLLGFLSHEPRHIDDIADAADLPIAEIATTLLMMELQGLVRNHGAQQYALAR